MGLSCPGSLLDSGLAMWQGVEACSMAAEAYSSSRAEGAELMLVVLEELWSIWWWSRLWRQLSAAASL